MTKRMLTIGVHCLLLRRNDVAAEEGAASTLKRIRTRGGTDLSKELTLLKAVVRGVTNWLPLSHGCDFFLMV